MWAITGFGTPSHALLAPGEAGVGDKVFPLSEIAEYKVDDDELETSSLQACLLSNRLREIDAMRQLVSYNVHYGQL